MWVKKNVDTINPLIEAGQLIKRLPVLVSSNLENPFSKIPFSIVMTAACDIESCFRIEDNLKNASTENEFQRQVIFQIMLCPAFDEDLFMSGQHLYSIYNCKTKSVTMKEKENFKKDSRFFFIENNIDNRDERGVPNLFVDYKHYFTLPIGLVKEHIKLEKEKESENEKYVLEHIQYTKLSDLFAHYLQRVAIP